MYMHETQESIGQKRAIQEAGDLLVARPGRLFPRACLCCATQGRWRLYYCCRSKTAICKVLCDRPTSPATVSLSLMFVKIGIEVNRLYALPSSLVLTMGPAGCTGTVRCAGRVRLAHKFCVADPPTTARSSLHKIID